MFLVIALAGCAGEQGGTTLPPEESGAATIDWTPTPVKGLADCNTIPTDPHSDSDEQLPSLRLPCLTTPTAVNLADLGGRPILINLWATWCGPCREEMPVLQAASERYADEVVFVGVNTMDQPEAAAGFLQEVGVTYPQLVDLDGNLLKYTRVKGLPVTLLLDSTGRESTRHIGELRTDQIDDFVSDITASQ